MPSETFSPHTYPVADWSAASNWSGGAIPGAGTAALVNGTDAYIDPGTTLSASITLEGGAALIGNDAGLIITGSLTATDENALYANGAVVNAGCFEVTGTLDVVIQAGGQIAAIYGLTEPSFENTGAITVTNGGQLNISGTEFSNTGAVDLVDGALIVDGGWVDGGQGALIPGGEITLSRGAYAAFDDGVADQSFTFAGPGTIAFEDPADLHAVAIAGFGYRDEILTNSVAAAESLIAGGLTFTTDLLENYTLAVQSLASGAAISLQYDASPPCFARGSRLLTPTGYAPVEDLKPGGLVITHSGAARPISWIGWRTIDLATHTRPQAIRPIRIRAGAIDDFTPARDVTLSPDHALYLRGQLVPVKYLVNGATIIRDSTTPAVTYFHIELDHHDILIAENLAVESYIDTGNRNAFANCAGTPRPNPVFGRGRQWDSRAAANLCTAGPLLRDIRRALLARVTALGYRHRTIPAISLLANGKPIPRAFGAATLPCFRLPPGHDGVWTIRSAAFVPAEMSCGDTDDEDWRELGIAIRRVKLDLKSVALRDIARSGIHPRAAGDVADWTDGNATIEIPKSTTIIGFNVRALPKTWQAPLGLAT